MDFKRTTVAQFDDILRLIQLGQSDRKIARSSKCRRTLIAKIRKGTLTKEELERLQVCERAAPGWTLQIDWQNVEADIRDGHQQDFPRKIMRISFFDQCWCGSSQICSPPLASGAGLRGSAVV